MPTTPTPSQADVHKLTRDVRNAMAAYGAAIALDDGLFAVSLAEGPNAATQATGGIVMEDGIAYDRANGLAFISIIGPVMPRGNALYDMFGINYASSNRIGAAADRLAADEGVKQVVLLVHSPGGSTFGVPEAAAKVRALADKKPVTAYIEYMAASAAYWIASQASTIVAAPSALVGSIGAYMVHYDLSAYYANEGVKVTYVAQPAEKVDGNEAEPLSERARQEYAEIVRSAYEPFVADVQRKRPVDFAKNAGQYAHTHPAGRAVELGLVDRLATLDVLRAEMTRKPADFTATRRARVALISKP